eukprot:Nitzschia sp. Nitz4//scaffold17_size182527//13412//14443//NITZ4_001828-RA/size182527-processed-gene-0.2-mRNA-1//1//CDS//3329539262//2553//frame0
MSERMIELRRAKMSQSPGKGNLQNPHASTMNSQVQTPQQQASTQVLSEDAHLQRFIHRLQHRDDSFPLSDSQSTGPTVPTALSRRALQRQGVGYLDDTVASAISASADRFLATILQQAVVCRDQRLKGAEMTRAAAKHRKRHIQEHQADTDDRKRRRDQLEQAREQSHLKAIAAADAMKKSSGSAKKPDDKKKKKKKVEIETPDKPGDSTKAAIDLAEESDESYDSIDEEEEYYQEKLGDVRLPKGEDDEEDDTLLLRDLVKPLEAWDFSLTGKEALEDEDSDSDDESHEREEEEKAEASGAADADDLGNDDDMDMDAAKSDTKSEDGDAESKKEAASPTKPS